MPDQILESTQFEITSLNLISSSGQSIDIKFLCQDLNIYEGIYDDCVSGSIVMKDTQNLPVALRMHGNEYIYLDLEVPSLKPIKRYFRVYAISDMELSKPTTFKYTIHFCSEEGLLNQQILISKSYKAVKTSDIASDILQNTLKVPTTRIANIESTVKQQNLIIPNMKPFEALNWLSSFSMNSTVGSAYLFYETTAGYNFRSLESLFREPVYKKVTITPKNANSDNDKATENRFSADRFEIPQPFNSLETLSTGGFSSTMIKLQLEGYKYDKIDFNLIKNKFSKLNENDLLNDAKNRFDKTLPEGSGYARLFPSFQDELTDKWLLQRAAQLSLFNSNRMNIQLSGDSQLYAGAVLELDFPLVQPTDSAEKIEKDPMKSGKYLVTQLRHRIFENKYYNYMEICKDSMMDAIPAAVSNRAYDEAKKS